MKNIFACALLLLACASCKDKEVIVDTTINYTVQDSVVFTEGKTVSVPISVTNTTDPNLKYVANFYPGSNASKFVFSQNSVVINANSTSSIDVKYSLFDLNKAPTTVQVPFEITKANVNFVPIKRNINFVYRPNCAHTYNGYKNGQITYVINGILLYKSITCNYNEDGNLEVAGLTNNGEDYILIFNCSANSISLKPHTVNGNYYTGNGYVHNGIITLNIFSNGTNFATASLLP
jgi:hypothetical protein